MKKYFYHLLTLSVLFTYFNFSVAQTFDLSKKIPIDTSVITGELDNGLRYYIKKNNNPGNKIYFQLVVNAGSILEDDDQQGLAHFIEHMGFNGTRSFKKNLLISYLENVGVSFGPDLNAYTSYDETIYELPVPTTHQSIIDTALLILEDWAFNITFDHEEIDKERGVILEELRLKTGPEYRIYNKNLQYTFNNSKYSDGLTIGKKEIIEKASYETIKKFYKDWYRPNLMAVIAVGDLEPQKMKAKIEKHFASYSNPENSRERIVYEVPDYEENLVSINTDAKLSKNTLSITYLNDKKAVNTWGDLRNEIEYNFFHQLIQKRLFELSDQQSTISMLIPIISTLQTGANKFLFTQIIYLNNDVENVIKAYLKVIEKIKKYGFSDTEFNETKKELLDNLKNKLSKKGNIKSLEYVDNFKNNFLHHFAIPGKEAEIKFEKQILEKIKIEDINQVAIEWFKDKNSFISISEIANENSSTPSKDDILSWIAESKKLETPPFVDKLNELNKNNNGIKSVKLMDELPENNDKILVEEKKNIDLTKLTLSNGVKIYLKPTDFNKDQILFYAFSPGGLSALSDEDFFSAAQTFEIITSSGVNGLSRMELYNHLKGNSAEVIINILDYIEEVSGRCIPKDLETALQLVYLYFTKPNFDEKEFSSMISMQMGFLKNQFDDPFNFYYDQLYRLLQQNHPRGKYFLTEKDYAKIDHKVVYDAYLKRFADANDFTFFFVGHFEVEKMKPLLNKYLGNLPTLPSKEEWIDHNIRPPKGIIEKTIKKGHNEKSVAKIIFTGEIEYNFKNKIILQILESVLYIKLTENLREKLSGVYNFGIDKRISKIPYENYEFTITIPCGPEKVDKLVDATIEEIRKLKENGPTLEDFGKAKKENNFQENIQSNSYWLDHLSSNIKHNREITSLLKNNEIFNEITTKDVQELANKIFNTDNYIVFILKPEN